MKQLSTKKIREEVHSNLTLVSSVFSLVIFTLILFIYNNISNPASIEFCSSLSLSLSFLFAGVAIILTIITFTKKKYDYTEYAVFSFILSSIFFLLKGNYLTYLIGGLENAIIISVFVTSIYWILSILHHCFFKDKMTPGFLLSIILCSLFFIVMVSVFILNFVLSPTIIF